MSESNGHRILTRADILGADDLPRERVDVPEWGGSVYVRTMTGAERDQFEAAMYEVQGAGYAASRDYLINFRAKFAALCIVDENGNRLFSDDDVVVLGQKSVAALQRVLTVAQRLNALTEADVEALRKNSNGPVGASPSGSR